MDNIARLLPVERSQIFSETAARMGTTPAIVEKDFWVCWVLAKIFASLNLKSKLMFKGGTSLSKVYKVIERFSEDIDLVLDWDLVSSENPSLVRSKNKQNSFNRQINEYAQGYIATQLLPELEALYAPLCKLAIDQRDPHCVNISYPRAFDDTYIRPEVRLEIGPLASWQPNREFTITSYAEQYFPELFRNGEISVRAIEGKRTFWEKATILHQESHRPEGKAQPRRFSRHYYDLAMLAQSEIRNQALSDLDLLRDVVDFKMKFYPVGWAHYEMAVPSSLRLIPSEEIRNSVTKDYRAMQDMIFGYKPSISEIFDILADLEEQINNI
jgi:hypothetical protein